MRIGIVNGTPLLAETLRRVISMTPEHQEAWIAATGHEAVQFCRDDRPDLVLMDLTMPGMESVEATRRIMAETPCAILLVTTSVEANAPRIFEAMRHGALDAVDAPPLEVNGSPQSVAPLLRKITAIGRLIGHPPGPIQSRRAADPPSAAHHPLVAIGASAGGPAALSTVLGGLPKDFPAAVVIVQHVDSRFAAGMAAWLGEYSAMPVLLAQEDDTPRPGTVLLAAGDDHLTLKSASRLGYTSEPRDYVYRPSVDVFFRSVERLWKGNAVGVLLTGMGRDGAQGLKALRARGCYTIAQDRATSAVYGMPKAAAELGAAVDILPLSSIAPRLIGAIARRSQERPRS